MRIAMLLLVLGLTACTPYKMDIRQGNYIQPEMRERLKVGMSQTQVRAVLGTPLINDVFHANRWDYVYRVQRGDAVVEQQRLTLYFEDGRLQRIEDELGGQK